MDESTLSPEEQKERKIMKLLLKIKNGTPPMRKVLCSCGLILRSKRPLKSQCQNAKLSPIARSTPSTEPVRGDSVNICLLKNVPFEEPAAFSGG